MLLRAAYDYEAPPSSKRRSMIHALAWAAILIAGAGVVAYAQAMRPDWFGGPARPVTVPLEHSSDS